MLEIRNLTAEYQQNNVSVQALKEVNLTVEKGKTCAVIGPSGCGKSTLLYCISDLVKPEQGEVLLNEQSIKTQRRRIVLILQQYGLLPWKTVYDNILLGLKLRNINSGYKDRVEELMAELEIKELKEHYPSQLSGGQRQRVAIARALTLEPELLLMDEPFSSLDALTREQLQNHFLKIWEKYRMTAILVTHSIEEAVFLGQKIVVFSSGPGQIIAEFNNDHFAREDWRESASFYEKCRQIRAALKEGV